MIYGMSTERRMSYSEIESNKLLLRETTWAGLEDVTVGRSHADARADTLRESGRWMRRGQGSRGRSSWRRDTAPALGARGAGASAGARGPRLRGGSAPSPGRAVRVDTPAPCSRDLCASSRVDSTPGFRETESRVL